MIYSTYRQAVQDMIDIGHRMTVKQFVAANDGNMSCKIGPNRIVATPTGVAKGELRPEQFAVLDLDGRLLTKGARPSTEIKMHLRVYQENPAVQAVVHAHPPFATVFACAGCSLPQEKLPETHTGIGTVPVAPFAEPGTRGVADSIAPFCQEHVAVLLERHGALAWGQNLWQAWYRLEVVEHHAAIYWHLLQLKQEKAR